MAAAILKGNEEARDGESAARWCSKDSDKIPSPVSTGTPRSAKEDDEHKGESERGPEIPALKPYF